MMSITYKCRHCGVEIGTLEQEDMSIEKLGFHHLTLEERTDMVQYNDDGSLEVKISCDDCHEALERNPLFHEIDRWIQ